MQDIHDIRPPVQVGMDPMLFKIFLLILAGVILLVLLFFLVRKFLKRRKSVQAVTALPEPLAPYDTALESLERLSQKGMTDPRLFYFDLTGILRRYTGGTFGINAVEMTSQEFIRALNRLDLDMTVNKDILRFQAVCDPCKYAGMSAPEAAVKQDLVLIKDIINRIEAGQIDRKNQLEAGK